MKETWEDDRDPLAALREGDSGPFEAFVGAELPTFLGFFRRLGAGRAEAEDLAQELSLKLYEHATTYERQGRFAAYAFRVARNLWIDASRRSAGSRRRRERDPEGEERLDRLADPGAPEPGSRLARAEEARRLRAALERLPERHRLVFELGVMQGLPYHEIGSVLEIPVGTVKSRMFHAVRKLRASLGEDEEPRRGGVPA